MKKVLTGFLLLATIFLSGVVYYQGQVIDEQGKVIHQIMIEGCAK